MEQADLGEKLINKYSWATPDERALRILKEFSPIVEIGCGANAFWCRSMAAAGIDIIGYDISVQEGGKIKSSNNDVSGKKKSKQTQNQNSSSRGAPTSKDDFQIRQGGPEVLASREVKNSNRTLFLCYPDEDFNQEEMEQNDKTNDEEMSVMGAACLEQYHGQYVVHVGELYGDTLSLDQAPWGRSSGRDFQQRLAAEYHCILKVGLQNWLHVKDTISVWKRSEKCSIVFAADDEDEDDEDEEVEYVHVPVEERLPVDVAAPCAQHLIMISHAAEGAGKGSLVKQDNAPLPLLPAGENSRAKKRQKSISEESSTIEHSDGYTCPW